jgi:hypothetical protein
MHSRGASKKLNVEFRIWDQQKNEHPTSNPPAADRIMYPVNLKKGRVSLLRRSSYEDRERIFTSNFFDSLVI